MMNIADNPHLHKTAVSGCAFQSVEEKTRAIKSLVNEQRKLIINLSKLVKKPAPKHYTTAIKRCVRIVGLTMRAAAIQIDTINSQKVEPNV